MNERHKRYQRLYNRAYYRMRTKRRRARAGYRHITKKPHELYCLHCGERIAQEKRSDSKYCTKAHKLAHFLEVNGLEAFQSKQTKLKQADD